MSSLLLPRWHFLHSCFISASPAHRCRVLLFPSFSLCFQVQMLNCPVLFVSVRTRYHRYWIVSSRPIRFQPLLGNVLTRIRISMTRSLPKGCKGIRYRDSEWRIIDLFPMLPLLEDIQLGIHGDCENPP